MMPNEIIIQIRNNNELENLLIYLQNDGWQLQLPVNQTDEGLYIAIMKKW